jgi:hypothetical protein
MKNHRFTCSRKLGGALWAIGLLSVLVLPLTPAAAADAVPARADG